ncbi:ArsR/SmtB family transcription factor [Streptomyces sp. NPDC017991]|uniref:ArsR/SmtB family transcription factor n=1 Tax=Streptomyces sp. NPDC017991 TaxID=3365026 RepID=UPI00378BD895
MPESDATPATPATPQRPSAHQDTAVLDAKGLRALAHPVRVQLLGLLRKHGPSTATRLAERLGVNSGTASYHLRRLGDAGLVEEDTERGNARERWWRSAHSRTWFNDHDLAEREPEATLAYLQSVAALYTARTERALGELQTMPRVWRDTFDMSDWVLRLTPAEAAGLYEELRGVVSRYRQDTPEAATPAPEGAERFSVITHLLPEPGTSAADPDPDPNPDPASASASASEKP